MKNNSYLFLIAGAKLKRYYQEWYKKSVNLEILGANGLILDHTKISDLIKKLTKKPEKHLRQQD